MKTVENYTDYGFGFPVVIDRVEMGHFEGEEVPLLNFNELEDKVIKAMPDRAVRLSGNEVRFIRLHFGLTLSAFGKLLGVTHVAVKDWEEKFDKPTNMEWAKEKNLRLYIMRKVGSDQDFLQLFDGLENERPTEPEPLRIAMEQWQPYSFEKCEFVHSENTDAHARDSEIKTVLHGSYCEQGIGADARYDRVPGNYAGPRKTGVRDEYHLADAA